MADAPKLLGTDTLRQAYPKFNNAIENANEALSTANTAKGTADTAKSTADTALANSESTQTQLDAVVIDGDSSPQIAQALAGTPYTTLRQKHDAIDNRLADIAVSVKTFGAKGDGITIDSKAFQDANDYLVSVGGGTLLVPSGVYLTNFVIDSHVHLVGSGVRTTVLKSAPNSNLDVIHGRNFLNLTGTAKQTPETRGVRNISIEKLLVDGNKQNNQSGFGIRIWGCSWKWNDILVQNCVQDGIYTDFTTHDSPVGLLDPSSEALESVFNNIKTINNNGNGWTYFGPHDGSIINFITFGNKGWGLEQGVRGSVTGFLWNSWLNDLGSFKLRTSTHVYKLQATGPYTGVGVDIDGNAGNIELANTYISGHETGAILRGTNVRIEGNVIENRNLANTDGVGIVIDGCINYQINVTCSNNKNTFNYITSSGRNVLIANVIVPSGGSLLKSVSAGKADDFINIISTGASNENIFQLPTREINVAGYKPKMPQSNGTIITDTTIPVASQTARGTVYQIAAPANLTGSPTAQDFNNLIQLLKYSGVLG